MRTDTCGLFMILTGGILPQRSHVASIAFASPCHPHVHAKHSLCPIAAAILLPAMTDLGRAVTVIPIDRVHLSIIVVHALLFRMPCSVKSVARLNIVLIVFLLTPRRRHVFIRAELCSNTCNARLIMGSHSTHLHTSHRLFCPSCPPCAG